MPSAGRPITIGFRAMTAEQKREYSRRHYHERVKPFLSPEDIQARRDKGRENRRRLSSAQSRALYVKALNRRRERYHKDPGFRKKTNARANAYKKRRYAIDPEYRVKLIRKATVTRIRNLAKRRVIQFLSATQNLTSKTT
jgi:hypothetical protein